MTTFEFHREDDGSLSLESAVFQALGGASTCWVPTPTGVFDSTRAKDIGDALLIEIARWASAYYLSSDRNVE